MEPSLSIGVRSEVTRLFGRTAELERLRRLFDDGARLVSVLGPAGVGKSRLAQEYAYARARDLSPARVCVVGAADAPAREQLAGWIGAALSAQIPGAADVRSAGELADVLACAGHTLLVLDDVETVAETAADLVGGLLAAAPDLQVLVTSRRALRLRGEARLTLAPLPHGSAVALFLDRARARRPSWEPDPIERHAVDAIVRRLDAIPLALELAAAWTDVISPPQLLERLDRRFELLGDDARDRVPRHASLAAAIESSWQLLTPPARDALAAWSVFHGGFDLAAASAVVSAGAGNALVLLRQLCDASLVVVQTGRGCETRHDMYESVREFAAIKLTESGARREVEARHARHFAAQARLQRGAGSGSPAPLRRWATEWVANIAAAAGSVLEPDRGLPEVSIERGLLDDAAELCGALVAAQPSIAEAHRALVDRMCARAETSGAGQALVCGLVSRCALASHAMQLPELERDATRAAALASAIDDRELEAVATRWLGRARWAAGAWDDAERLFGRALSLATAGGDGGADPATLHGIGMIRWALGRWREAADDVERALNIAQQRGDTAQAAQSLAALAGLRFASGHLDEALALGRRARAIAREANAPDAELYAAWDVGLALIALGRCTEAASRLDRALALAEEQGFLARRAHLMTVLAMVRLAEGELDEAELLSRSVLAMPGVTWRGWHLSWAAAIAAERGELAEARSRMEEARRAPAPPVPSPSPSVAAVLEGFIHLAEAREAETAGDVAGQITAAGRATACLRQAEEAAPGAAVPGHVRAAAVALRAAIARSVAATPGRERAPDKVRPSLEVASDAGWFSTPTTDRVDLARRGPLKRMLSRLIQVRIDAAGTALSNQDLLEAGWPGQRVLPEAGAMRVYAGVATLRRLGLRGILLTRDDGYLLDPGTAIEIATTDST